MRALDRYRIIRPLGRGAAGGVFLVSDRIRGGAPIALKRIHARADELLRSSFEREFVALTALSLPGVAPVFDFGLARAIEGDEGGPFFTRAFIDGQPLDDAAAGKSTADRVRVFVSVCEVVGPLHSAGVVHGDIKPGNVILDARGAAHVIDFGLARLPTRRDGTTGGTPGFMAPELFAGGSPTAQSDVFALGATLWTLLLGEPPHGGSLGAGMRGDPPRIPENVEPDVRAALTIAIRAMDPDRNARIPNVRELVAALDPAARAAKRHRFVPPRPRGHSDVVARLDARVTARNAAHGPQTAIVVSGARGAGKSTVLRELKWRAQLRGVSVLEASSRGAALEPVASLMRQVAFYAEDGDAVPETITDLSETTVMSQLARGIARVASLGPTLVLVDDVDDADAVLGRALRTVIHGEGAERVALVATATSINALAVRELGAREVLEVPPLGRDVVTQLAHDALGPVDTSVVEALISRTSGTPAELVDALAALYEIEAPTARDVAGLPLGGAGIARARQRLSEIAPEAQKLLHALVVAGGLPVSLSEGLSGAPEGSLATLEQKGLLRVDGSRVSLEDRTMEALLLEQLGDDGLAREAARIAKSGKLKDLPLATRARIAVLGGDESMHELVPRAVEKLAAAGANEAALELTESLVERCKGAALRAVRLQRARLLHALGRYEDAWNEAGRVLDDGSATAAERGEAAVAKGRAQIGAGQFDDAIKSLSLVPDDAEPRVRATALRELAKVRLRRGEYDAVEQVVKSGLACAPPGDVVRVELLTTIGMVASYRGDREAARTHYDEALAVALAAKSRRDEATVRTYIAIDHHRAGEYGRARDLYAESLEIARELGDVGSMATFALNLGAVTFHLGKPARAAEHYESAAKLARRAGMVGIDVGARVNLASLHVYLGLYEQARNELERVLADAEEAGLKPAAAQALAYSGDLAARTGEFDAALAYHDDAIGRYRQLGQRREVLESTLDIAEALLDRDGPVDSSAAAARLAAARSIVDEDKLEEFRHRLRMLLARTRGQTGDLSGAATDLETLLAAVQGKDRELEWQVLRVLGSFHAALCSDFLARKYDQQAMEALEAIATGLPRDLREAFWHDPRRRDVRRRAGARESTHQQRALDTVQVVARGDARATRLLEIIKRLASEHELDRLLERITESAVELSGAERGFVLLVGADSKLEARTMSTSPRHNSADPSVAFSRSIAEAVLIDGEPILTVDARDDRRLSEYMSVHKLALKSVACLPIRGRSGTVGVLYLEHRLRPGRFAEQDMELLFAFADQAAIAVENARLYSELESRRVALEKANADLAQAKAEIERVLAARTTELQETKRELGRARDELRGAHDRHGIVGGSEPIRRVFAVIDRVQDSTVPVVIQGESGTGKELVARAIHYGGPRQKKPFIAINCAAMPEALLESELFGHVRGAFTGADKERRGMISQATGGTLFLDEVGDMPTKMQVDLLRVLQDGKVRPVGGDKEEVVDIRVIAASNKSLRQLVKQNVFREDLYYRLNVVELALPPLRDRPDDIPLLVDHFLMRFAKRDGVKPKKLSRAALQRLSESQLPGNVRQLEHLLLNAWVLVEGDVIDDQDLALGPGYGENLPVRGPMIDDDEDDEEDESEPPSRLSAGPRGEQAGDLPKTFSDFKAGEKTKILEALEKHAWNRAKAAKQLGIPRRTFYRRLREHGIL